MHSRQAGVPVLVEAERLRPGLEGLLALADYVVTSAHFPQVCNVSTLFRVPSTSTVQSCGTRQYIMAEQ